MGWSRRELDELLAQFYDTVFSRYAEQHGKRRWGDKTPLHTWHVDAMARLFPEAQFVGIVRHPGGSVGSNLGRWKSMSKREAFVHTERYYKELARQAGRHADQFCVLRYEDLVLRPEATMRELLDWLGEPWSPSVLEHHTVQSARGGKAVVEGRSAVADPIDVARVSKWTKTLDEKTRAAMARRLERLGDFFGYAIDEPVEMTPFGSDPEALVVTGADIEARIDRFPELDLRTQGPIPRNERFYDPREWELRLIVERPKEPTPREAARIAARPVVRRLPAPARRAVSRAARRVRAR